MIKVAQHFFMIPLFISAILSLRFLRKSATGAHKVLAAFLCLIFIVELMAILWKYSLYNAGPRAYSKNNVWIYNLSLPLQYLLFSLFYFKVFINPLHKKLLAFSAAGLLIFSLINILFIQQLFILNYYTAIAANILFVIWATQFFTELWLKEPQERLDKNPLVWISIGNFIFHSGSLPYLVALGFPQLYTSTHFMAFFYVYTVLHSFMYITFIIAFLCNPPQQN
jgi:hypothetical protein